ncbi:MAG: GGDEF domain-containing protein, partial [Oscillospiraceae bacterium]|nr:GGDEF domain-containing protein [Oscillospiraceae bacterium]
IQRQYEEIMEMNRQLSQMVMTDPLTGLHNRRWLEEALRPQLEKDMVFSDGITGMMLDIDYFKEYNDCYGHIAGDRCLTELAAVLSAAAERSELQLVRYGGEEFFLCGECGGKAPLSAAEEVREAVEEHGFLRKDRPEGRLTVSIGVYCSEPGRKVRLEELVSRADAALYQAKKCGRNRAELLKEDKARL